MNPEPELSLNQRGQLAAWEELESRGLDALYPLIPPLPCKMAAVLMQTHQGQKRCCSILSTNLSSFLGPLMCPQWCISTVS